MRCSGEAGGIGFSQRPTACAYVCASTARHALQELPWAGLPLLSLLPLDAFVPKVTAKDSSKKDKKKDEEVSKGKGTKHDDKVSKLKEKQEKEAEAKAQKAKDDRIKEEAKEAELKEKKQKEAEKVAAEEAKEAKLKEKKQKEAEKVAAEEAKEAKLKEKKQKEAEKVAAEEAKEAKLKEKKLDSKKVSAAKTSKKDKGGNVAEVHAQTQRAQTRPAIKLLCVDVIAQAESATTKAGADGAKEDNVKSKKSKDAAAASHRQSPRLAAAGGGAIVPVVDIGKKRKADASPDMPAATGAGSKSGSRAGNCFVVPICFDWDCFRGSSFCDCAVTSHSAIRD
jgi:colicin import membrane protein